MPASFVSDTNIVVGLLVLDSPDTSRVFGILCCFALEEKTPKTPNTRKRQIRSTLLRLLDSASNKSETSVLSYRCLAVSETPWLRDSSLSDGPRLLQVVRMPFTQKILVMSCLLGQFSVAVSKKSISPCLLKVLFHLWPTSCAVWGRERKADLMSGNAAINRCRLSSACLLVLSDVQLKRQDEDVQGMLSWLLLFGPWNAAAFPLHAEKNLNPLGCTKHAKLRLKNCFLSSPCCCIFRSRIWQETQCLVWPGEGLKVHGCFRGSVTKPSFMSFLRKGTFPAQNDT